MITFDELYRIVMELGDRSGGITKERFEALKCCLYTCDFSVSGATAEEVLEVSREILANKACDYAPGELAHCIIERWLEQAEVSATRENPVAA